VKPVCHLNIMNVRKKSSTNALDVSEPAWYEFVNCVDEMSFLFLDLGSQYTYIHHRDIVFYTWLVE